MGLARETASRYVTPSVRANGTVVCECGHPMNLWDYTSFPGGKRWQFYRCSWDADHVTHALPLRDNVCRPTGKATVQK